MFPSQNQNRAKGLLSDLSKSDFPGTFSISHTLFSSVTREVTIVFQIGISQRNFTIS